ncbi:hypothetical protein RD110_00600 [Rhodoferax koreense]|uniref:Uncharacterized protein n=1 Tax=Rhodoferax koreensis TaxID=1842727 RepID=A0A1P8JQ75_9BURK|nr:AsmA-like C-terminal region-containing protein [Rhodoferax koreense]APW35893.1 hypothetical protein RD110_00600 [Rhodoferax koreense]
MTDPHSPSPGRRRHPRLLIAGGVAVVAGLGLAWWFPSEQDLAERAARAASERLGVPVTVGALHWQLLPAPGVQVENVRTDQPQPIVIDRANATLRVAALWRGQVELTRLEVDGATVPQLSLRGLGAADSQPVASHLAKQERPLAHLQVRDIRWISRNGRTAVYEGEADFDPGWRPHSARLRRPGATDPATLQLMRVDGADRWQTEVRIGGGTADGELALQIDPGDLLKISGQLAPKNIEVQSALDAFGRRSPVSGRASGQTEVAAQGLKFGEIVRSAHTHTSFRMAPATLVRFDLDRAVRTLGKEHAGTTRLDTLTGLMDTQNSADGMIVRFTGLKAKSGSLTASGDVTLAQQQIDATAAVDLVDGVVGVPLRITGPLAKMQVSVPGGAVAGAVVGTAVLPGIGTAIGARIGATIDKLLGRDDPPPKPAPRRP